MEELLIFRLQLRHFSMKKYNINNFGLITSLFLIFYGMFRLLIEFIREPDSHIGLIFNLITMGQILSIPLVILGVGIYIKTYLK